MKGRPIRLPAPYLKRLWLDNPRRRPRRPIRSACRSCTRVSILTSTTPSRSSSAKTAPGNRRCSKASPHSPDTTRRAAARATCRSTIRGRWRRWAARWPRRCARAGCRRSPMAGSSAPRAFFTSRATSSRAAQQTDGGFSLAFARRGLPAVFRRALPASGHLHFRRAGIGAVAVAADRVPQAAARHGTIRHLPGHHGDAFAAADGLSGGATVAIDARRARAGARQETEHYRLDARVLGRPEDVHRDGFERLIVGCHAWHACACLSRRGSIQFILVSTKNDRRVHSRGQGRVT